ncbi:MAG: type IV pilus secretin PilQ, partial [Myxococcota bacterium]|nr:type IV pilus secretin PilQ [Myxococcota bacterium]
VRVGNVLRIAPSDVLAQEEEVRLQERRAKEKLEDLVVKLIPVNYGDVKDLAGLVKRLLTSRGSVNVDARTSTLIVKDIPSVIDETTALVAAVDTETPQVMIEAKIVEANLDFARELGSVWSVGKQQLTDGFDSSSAVKDNIGGDNIRLAPSAFRSLGQSNNTSFLNSITAQPTALFNLSAFLLDDTFNIDVQLQAAESTGNGKVVSSPRIVTLDNRPASVQQGVSIPFQTFENGDAKLEFIDAVLSLEVTPHITSDKSIIMEIEVTRDAPDASIPTQTGSPAIAKNQAKTETLVKDSQTLVLGGIYTVDKTFRQSRVPYLHRIPLVGSAFKSKEVSDTRKELLIFVTPRIVVQPTEEG